MGRWVQMKVLGRPTDRRLLQDEINTKLASLRSHPYKYNLCRRLPMSWSSTPKSSSGAGAFVPPLLFFCFVLVFAFASVGFLLVLAICGFCIHAVQSSEAWKQQQRR